MNAVFIPLEEDIKRWIREAVKEELAQSMSSIRRATGHLDEPLLTRSEIAKVLRISLVTLGEWVKRGMPYHCNKKSRAKKGRVLFLKSEALAWMKEYRDG